MSYGSTAKKVRERKEAHPELYCEHPKCLWFTGNGNRCQKHDPILVRIHDTENAKRFAIDQGTKLGQDYSELVALYDEHLADLKALLKK
jgi:hypothetical protein